MILNDIIKETGKSIFSIFRENFPATFTKIFPNITVENLDLLVNLKHGKKEVFENVTRETFVFIVTAIIAAKSENWEKQHTAINTEYILNAGESETKTKSGNITRNGNNTEIILNAEKVFNDVDFVDNEKANTNAQNNTVDTYDLTETNIKTLGNVLDNIQKELYFRRENNFYNDVINEIIKEIVLEIYV